MLTNPPAVRWLLAVAFGQALLAGLLLAWFGAGERGTDIALQATARAAFLLFWPAYTGSALYFLFGGRFGGIARAGRWLGLAFAVAQTVHVGLVAWLCWIGATPAAGVFLLFGTALLWLYLLVALSLPSMQHRLGRTYVRIARTLGMNYIAYVFLVDFVRFPLLGDARRTVEYFPFVALSVLGPLLYWTGFLLRREGQAESRH